MAESNVADENINDAEAQAGNEEKCTKIEAKKVFNDICNFRDHFSWKSFFIALIFGLIPSGLDTSSDFAFAADDHNSTIELINAADFIITTRFPNGTYVYAFTNEPNMSIAPERYPSGNLKIDRDTNRTQTWQIESWRLDESLIRRVTYLIVSMPTIVAMLSWFLNVDCIKMFNRERTTLRIAVEALVKISVVVYPIMGLGYLFFDSEREPIFYLLARVSVALVMTVKILALFVHGPEMKKLSLRATLAESSNESAVQLIFVSLISFWARELSTRGLMSMTSSIVMIGKASAESHLTFGSKDELDGVSLKQHICLLAKTAPVFILTAVFRVGSFSVTTAWNWSIMGIRAIPIVSFFFLLSLVFVKCCRPTSRGCSCSCRTGEREPPGSHYLDDLSLGNLLKSYIAELSTTSNWGGRGRESSRWLQLMSSSVSRCLLRATSGGCS